MESLALVVVFVFLGIIALFAASVFVAIRNPDRTWSRGLGVAVSVPTIASGIWLMWVGGTSAMRIISGITIAVGLIACVRCVKKG